MCIRDSPLGLPALAGQQGTMDLISVETRFILAAEGKPAALLPRQSGEAEGMIEQFMIAANVAVAALARRKKLPFIYRVHERPNPEKLALLMETTRALGPVSYTHLASARVLSSDLTVWRAASTLCSRFCPTPSMRPGKATAAAS